MSIDVKSPFVKSNRTYNINFSKLKARKYVTTRIRWWEIFIIISNTVWSKTSPFMIFIWQEQHQMGFVTMMVQKSTTTYHLHWYKTGIEFLILEFLAVSSWYRKYTGILSHKIPRYTITNAVYFDWGSTISWHRNVFKGYLCYKTITSQNMSSEIKNFFIW